MKASASRPYTLKVLIHFNKSAAHVVQKICLIQMSISAQCYRSKTLGMMVPSGPLPLHRAV